ncbi:MAG: hypothetical protein Q4E37_04750 [Tissierellia bacterium]|nr:hypothetical protein [Tissierellia bacterium]
MSKKKIWVSLALIVLAPFLERAPFMALLPSFFNIQASLLVLVFLNQWETPYRYLAIFYLSFLPDLLVGPFLGPYLFAYLLGEVLLNPLKKWLGAPSPLRSFLMTFLAGLGVYLARHGVYALFGEGMPMVWSHSLSSLLGTSLLALVLSSVFGPGLGYENLREEKNEEDLSEHPE